MSPRTGHLRLQRSRGLGFEQLEDRWLLSGASLLGSVSLPLPVSLTASLSVDLAPLGVSVSASVQTGGNAPALTVAAAVTADPGTPSVPTPTASLAIKTPLASVSAAVSLGDGTGGNGGSTGVGSQSGAPPGSGNLTAGAGPLGSTSVTLGSNSSTNGGQGVTLPNLGGNPSGSQAPAVTLPPSFSATQPAAGSTAAQPGGVPAAPPAAGSDPAPFLVPALVAGASNASLAAQAIALSREAAPAVLSPPATVPTMPAASVTGAMAPAPLASDHLPAAADNGPTRTALRAAAYNLDEEDAGESPAEEALPDEATEAGLMGLVPADGSGIDQSLRQLLDQINNLGQGLNETLPGGLAFWVLAGAAGLTACVTVRRRQAAQAALSGDALKWIPSLSGFLPPLGG